MGKTKDVSGGEERLNLLQALPMYEDLTQTLKENPKVFTKDSRVKGICQDLSLTTNKGVVIMGTDGSGKTALVEGLVQYMQKDSSDQKDTHVIHIFPQGLESMKTLDNTMLFWEKICNEYKAKGITKLIFFFKVDIKTLTYWANGVENYIDIVKDAYKLDMLKVVIETTKIISKNKDNEKEYEPSEVFKPFVLWRAGRRENTPQDTLKVLKPRIKKLSEIYGVKYSKEVLLYFCFVFWDRLSCSENYKLILRQIDNLFAFAKLQGKMKVSKKLVRKIFKGDFQQVKATSKTRLKHLAYHETGHAVLLLEYGYFEKITYVKVVPSSGSNGMVKSTGKEFLGETTKKVALSKICVDLAGRISEELFCNSKPHSGARSDLHRANDFAENIAMNLGFTDEVGKNYVILDKKTCSQKELRKLEKERRQLLAEAEEMTIKTLMKHKKFVDLLAKKLQKEYIISGEEVYKMWKKYNKSR